jgi:iron complex outermembrane receptor protein
MVTANRMAGCTHGVELFATWKINDRWSLSPAYAFGEIHMHADPASQDRQAFGRAEGRTPRHWARLESHLRLYRHLQWDASATFVDRLIYQPVPSYTRIDTQLSWPWTENLSIRVAGVNLLRDRHLEFVDDTSGTPPSLSKRGVLAQLIWRF